MNGNLIKFLNREINSVNASVYIGREPATNGIDFITITPQEYEKPLYSFWYKQKKAKSDKPKHTGGKPSYFKVYLEKIFKDNLDYEVIGAGFKLARYLEWDSEYLVIGKGERKRHVKSRDIVKILKVSRATAFRLLKKMKKAGLIACDKKGYKLTGGYFIKGVLKNENKDK